MLNARPGVAASLCKTFANHQRLHAMSETETGIVPPLLKIVGIGHGGGVMVDRLRSEPLLAGVELAVVDMDQAELVRRQTPGRFCFGIEVTRGLGAGGDPGLGRSAAEHDAGFLRGVCTDARIVLLVTCLGGGAGSGATPVLARYARESGALVLAMVTTPFGFEGSLRAQNAMAGLRELRSVADAVIVLPNERCARLLEERTPVNEVFQRVAARVGDAVLGIWRLLNRPGLIPVDFATLERLVRGRNAECAYASAYCRGDNRCREAIDALLSSPFLDDGRAVAEADALLVHVSAGADLTLAEVERVVRELKRHHREEASVVVGTSIDDEFQGGIQLTLIATRRASELALNPGTPGTFPGRASVDGAGVAPPSGSERAEGYLRPLNTTPIGVMPARPPSAVPEMGRDERSVTEGRQGRRGGRGRKSDVQPELNLFVVSTGRFANTPATIHQNQNLDEPTYLRRNLVLN